MGVPDQMRAILLVTCLLLLLEAHVAASTNTSNTTTSLAATTTTTPVPETSDEGPLEVECFGDDPEVSCLLLTDCAKKAQECLENTIGNHDADLLTRIQFLVDCDAVAYSWMFKAMGSCFAENGCCEDWTPHNDAWNDALINLVGLDKGCTFGDCLPINADFKYTFDVRLNMTQDQFENHNLTYVLGIADAGTKSLNTLGPDSPIFPASWVSIDKVVEVSDATAVVVTTTVKAPDAAGIARVKEGLQDADKIKKGLETFNFPAQVLSDDDGSKDNNPNKVTVQMVVTVPYTIDTFTKDKQVSFKKGVAAAADTNADKVTINKITAAAGRRTLLQTGVDVDFSVEVPDAKAATELVSSNKLSQANLDTFLAAEGLEPISAIKSEAKVIDPTASTPSAAPAMHVRRAATLAAGLLLAVAAGL